MYSSKDTPFWTKEWAIAFIAWFEGIAWPCLCSLAILSSATAVIGFAGQFQNPDLTVYLRCAAVGAALLAITTAFWAACWTLPIMETRKALITYTISVQSCSSRCSGWSHRSAVLARPDQTSARIWFRAAILTSSITPARTLRFMRVRLMSFARGCWNVQIRPLILRHPEIAGDGPTGVSGAGSVSHSFGETGRSYTRAG